MYTKNNDGVNQRKRSSSIRNNCQDSHSYRTLNHTSGFKVSTYEDEEHGYYVKGKRVKSVSQLWMMKISRYFDGKKTQVLIILGIWCVIGITFIFSHIKTGEKLRAPRHQHPVVLGCHFSPNESKIVKLKRIPVYDEDIYPSKRHVDWDDRSEEMENSLRNSIKYDRVKVEDIEDYTCKLPHKWQSTSYPSCNKVHEHDLTAFFNEGEKRIEERQYLLDHGFFRDIWLFKDDIDRNLSVLKTLRYSHEVTDRNFNRHRRDALVMEKLSPSGHVAQIYSFCGNSIFSEYATEGTVSDIIWPLSGANCTLTSIERLQLAHKVAKAVTTVHMYDSNGTASVAHTDLTPSQFLVFDKGIIKLNDFNRCRFLAHDNKGQVCPYKVSHNPGKFRSPEEYNYLDQSEMVDVYSMGNIFYSIITEKWPYEEINNADKAQEKIKRGERPNIQISSDDKILHGLAEIIHLCWKQDPNERPSARQVVSLLESKIGKLIK